MFAGFGPKPPQKPESEVVPGEFDVRKLIKEMETKLDAYMKKQAEFSRWLVEHKRP